MEPLSYRAFTVSEVVSPSANRNGTLSPMAMPSSAALSRVHGHPVAVHRRDRAARDLQVVELVDHPGVERHHVGEGGRRRRPG